MRRVCGKFKVWALLLFLMFATAGVTVHVTSQETQAATAGFKKINGKKYYIKRDGSKQKGWMTLNGKKYYFNKTTGVMRTGWVKNSRGQKRFFHKTKGYLYTGWYKSSSGKKRYFNKKNGYMQTGWLELNGKKYYFSKKNGYMYTGFVEDSSGNTRYFSSKSGVMVTKWVSNSKGDKRYFDPKTGIMAKGFKELSGNTYYFYKGSGKMAKGWVKNASKGYQYYFDPKTGVMAVGKKTIGGVAYNFASNGILTTGASSSPTTDEPTGERTIKNYLAGALQPVGQALYVWGGGWNDSTRKGVSPTWKKWYNSQSSSYNYNNYRDLSATNRAKGLDCSGFVGWAAYQVMQKKSGVGYGYTVVSGDIGSYYRSLGWGSIISQSKLSKTNYKLYPGDIGYNSGHTWIVLGQCSDKSAVIVHSTPQAGCQISGTPTPSGNYSSQAITLAKKYMSRYSGYNKYKYNTSSGNYIRNGNYLRWNRNTLSDPNGYLNKTADQILADLFK